MNLTDLKVIEDEAKYVAQMENSNKEEAANEAVKRAICESVPESVALYHDVSERINNVGKRLIILIRDCNTDYISLTSECCNNIYIEFQSEKSMNEFEKIYEHELGEVDYIARDLPDIEDLLDRQRIKFKILELFSHKHVHHLLKNIYDLVEEDVSDEHRNYVLNKNFVDGQEVWKTILDICWELISFPELRVDQQGIHGYRDNSHDIEEILDMIESTNTLVENANEIRCVESNVNRVLEILGNHGLNNINVRSRL